VSSIAVAGKTGSVRPKFGLRTWATPVTIGAFVLMAGTGVLMFFGWRGGLTNEAHEWLSWLFLAGVAFHLVVNWRPLTLHLKSRGGKMGLAAGLALLAVVAFPSGIRTGHQLHGIVEQAVIEAPLSTLASLAKINSSELESRLRSQGVTATLDQSVRQISEREGVSEPRLLSIVFMNP
jgi:hypothetical protein